MDIVRPGNYARHTIHLQWTNISSSSEPRRPALPVSQYQDARCPLILRARGTPAQLSSSFWAASCCSSFLFWLRSIRVVAMDQKCRRRMLFLITGQLVLSRPRAMLVIWTAAAAAVTSAAQYVGQALHRRCRLFVSFLQN